MPQKFPPGAIVATAGVANEVPHAQIQSAIGQHLNGDWGEVCPDDAHANEVALRDGFRILSAYKTESGHTIWIITEADRSATTVLFPHEY